MLPTYGNSTNTFASHHNIELMKNYDNAYSSNFHSPSMYSTYENLSTVPQTNLLNIKTESDEQNEAIDSNFIENVKNSPLQSDRSESSYSSKLEISSRNEENLTNSMENGGMNSKDRQNEENLYRNIKDDNASEFGSAHQIKHFQFIYIFQFIYFRCSKSIDCIIIA